MLRQFFISCPDTTLHYMTTVVLESIYSVERRKIRFLETILRAKESELLEFLKIRTKGISNRLPLLSHLQ